MKYEHLCLLEITHFESSPDDCFIIIVYTSIDVILITLL